MLIHRPPEGKKAPTPQLSLTRQVPWALKVDKRTKGTALYSEPECSYTGVNASWLLFLCDIFSLIAQKVLSNTRALVPVNYMKAAEIKITQKFPSTLQPTQI